MPTTVAQRPQKPGRWATSLGFVFDPSALQSCKSANLYLQRIIRFTPFQHINGDNTGVARRTGREGVYVLLYFGTAFGWMDGWMDGVLIHRPCFHDFTECVRASGGLGWG